MNFDGVLQRWLSMYRQIFDIHRHQGDWLFLHYRQILSGSSIPRLEAFLNTRIKPGFADARLAHSFDSGEVPDEVIAVYEPLCNLAQFYPDS